MNSFYIDSIQNLIINLTILLFFSKYLLISYIFNNIKKHTKKHQHVRKHEFRTS